jgi:hypothetical protein
VAGQETTVFFAPDGKFTMASNGKVSQWHSEKELWENASNIEVPSLRAVSRYENPTPGGTRLTDQSQQTIGRDNHGVIWHLQAKGSLTKMVPGRTVSVFAPGSLNPFLSGGYISRVLVDDAGNAVLESRGYARQHQLVFVPAKLPPPQTIVRLVRTDADTAHLALGAGGAPIWHTWRVDEGEWKPLFEGSELTIEALTAGRHTVEVRSYNAELTPSKTVATVTFETTPSSEIQFASQLRDLASLDIDTREAAARKLKNQGAAALARLRASRESASPEVRWWIDAIIQHIERQIATNPK